MANRRSAGGARVRSVPVSEGDLHRSVAEFLDWMLLPPAVWTTFPAGWGKLGKATAGRLKACGLKEGMPDLFIFYDGRTHGIELKTPHGGHSPAQIEMAPKLFAAGVNVYTCRSLEEVRGYLIMHKIPMRNHYGIKTPETRCPSQPDASTAQA